MLFLLAGEDTHQLMFFVFCLEIDSIRSVKGVRISTAIRLNKTEYSGSICPSAVKYSFILSNIFSQIRIASFVSGNFTKNLFLAAFPFSLFGQYPFNNFSNRTTSSFRFCNPFGNIFHFIHRIINSYRKSSFL